MHKIARQKRSLVILAALVLALLASCFTATDRAQAYDSLIGSDFFNTSSSNVSLNTQLSGWNALPWVTSGDADDFLIVSASQWLQRTATGDVSGTGRFGYINTASAYNSGAVTVTFRTGNATGATAQRLGILMRYSNSSNYLRAVYKPSSTPSVDIQKRVAGGAITTIGTISGLSTTVSNTWYRLTLATDSDGLWTACVTTNASPETILGCTYGTDADVSPLFGMASGRSGIYDEHSGGNAATRNYDNVIVYSDPELPSATWSGSGTGKTASYTLTFEEEVTGLTAADITANTIAAGSGGASGCSDAVSGSGASYTVTISGCTTDGTVQPQLSSFSVNSVTPSGSFFNEPVVLMPSGVLNAATSTIDNTKPTASWSAVPSSPSNASSPQYTLTFSESVTGLTAADITANTIASGSGGATGCTAAVSGSGSSYTVTISGCSEGTLAPRLNADTVQDAAANIGPASSVTASTITIDRTAPGAPGLGSTYTTTSDSAPSWSWVAAEEGGTFECKMDSGSYATCSSPYTSSTLSDGAHTFYLRHLDAAGNSSTVVSDSFTVETSNPGAVQAGTYYTLNCAKSAATTVGEATNYSSGWAWGISPVGPCSSSWNAYSGATLVTGQIFDTTSGDYNGVRWTAPHGTTFSKVKAFYVATSASNRFSYITGYRGDSSSTTLNGSSSWPYNTQSTGSASDWNLVGGSFSIGATEVRAYLQCLNVVTGLCAMNETGASTYIAAPRFQISDTSVPTTPTLSGNALDGTYTTGGYDYAASGASKTLQSSSSDHGGGLYQVTLRVNGSTISGLNETVCTPKNQARWDLSGNPGNTTDSSDPLFPQGLGPCHTDSNYTSSSPDTDSVSSSSIDTGSGPWVEGTNTITSTAYDYANSATTGVAGDAAGNASTQASDTIVIDKTGPTVSSISCTGTNTKGDWYKSNVSCSLSGVSDTKVGVDRVSGVAAQQYYGVSTCTEGSPCSTSTQITTEGSHTITGLATDNVANKTAALSRPTATVKIDKTVPATPGITGPSGTITDQTPTFTLSGEATSDYYCSLNDTNLASATYCDSGSFSLVGSDVTVDTLSNDSYTLYVWQEDQAGNISTTYTSRSFQVDAPPPSINSMDVTFDDVSISFSGGDPTYECKLLDSSNAVMSDWGSCSSPKTYSNLDDDTYTFQVRSTSNPSAVGSDTFTIAADPEFTNSNIVPAQNGADISIDIADLPPSTFGTPTLALYVSTKSFSDPTFTTGDLVFDNSAAAVQALASGNTVNVTGLNPGTTYYVAWGLSWEENSGPNSLGSSEYTFQTDSVSISNGSVTSTGLTTANASIDFDLSPIPEDAIVCVVYGTETGVYETGTFCETPTAGTNTIAITGLSPGTTYYASFVAAWDFVYNPETDTSDPQVIELYQGSEVVFTSDSDSTPPALTNLQQGASQADPTNSSPITFQFESDEALSLGTITAADFAITNGSFTGVTETGAGPYTYEVVVSPSGQGAVTIAPDASLSIEDNNLNAATTITGGSDRSVTYDTAKPTASWSGTPSSPNKNTSVQYTLTFAEGVTGFTASDLVNVGSATGCEFAVEPLVTINSDFPYSVTISSCSEGTLTPALRSNSVQDLAGNDGPLSAEEASTITLDRTAPTLTLQQAAGQADPTKDAPAQFTLSGDENLDSTTITSADFTITNGTFASKSGSGDTYTINVTPSGQGAVTIAPSGSFSVTDEAGNAATVAGGADRSVTYDSTKPTASWSGTPSSPNKNTSVQYTLTFSESVTGLASGDLSNQGTATGCSFGVTGSGDTYTITISSCSEGTLQPRLAADSVTDAAGNTGPASAQDGSTITLDRTAPTITLQQAAGQADPTKNSPVEFTLSGEENLDGSTITESDFTITNATGFTKSGSGDTYIISLTPSEQGAVTIAPSGSFSITDSAGNAATTAGGSDRSVTYDTLKPTVTWSGTPSSPNKNTSVQYTLTFSESVTGLASGDLSNQGSATGCSFSVSGSGDTYTVTISSCSEGTLQPRLAADSVTDAAGNTGPATAQDASTITLDRTAPAAPTLNNSFTTTNDNTPTWSWSGAEAGGTYQCKIDSGSWDICSSPYTASTLSEGAHTFSVRQVDEAGNVGSVEVDNITVDAFNVDTTSPTLTLQQAAGQADPTKDAPVQFTLSGSENLDTATITSADFDITNGTFASKSGSGDTWTINVTPTAQGAVTIAPSASFSVTDTVGNAATTAGGSDRSVTYDTVRPDANWQAPPSSPTKGSPVFTLIFTESISGLTSSDFQNETYATATGCVFTPNASSGTNFQITVSGCSDGSLQPVLKADTVSDAAGNTGPTNPQASEAIIIDGTAPTLSLAQASGQADPTNNSNIEFTLSANDSLNGATITSADFTITNGTFSSKSQNTVSSYTINVTASGQGAVQIAPSGSFSVADMAGNTTTTAGGADRSVTYDSIAPGAPSITPVTDPTTDSTPTISFSGAEVGGTFECQIDSGSWSSCTSPYTTSSLADGSHTFSVRHTDTAGNTSTVASDTFVVDATAPEAPTLSNTYTDTTDATPTWSWTGAEGGGTYECKTDSGSWGSCSSPYTSEALADGSHTFSVRQVDGAGNVGSAASDTFTVDATVPAAPTLTATPNATDPDTTPTFEWTGAEGGGTYECKMDSGSWSACSSPYTSAEIGNGSHTFYVRQIDSLGNVGTAETFTWTISASAPSAPTISSGPDTVEDTTSATFVFSGAPGATFSCKLGAAEWTSCTSPKSYNNLVDGSYTFRLKQETVVAESSPTIYRWTVDTDGYDQGDTSSAANRAQFLSIHVNPAIEVLSVASDYDKVIPQSGGDAGAEDDASFAATVQLRSNLSWSSSATEVTPFGLKAGALNILTGASRSGNSNGQAGVGDGLQSYGVTFSTDISWGDDAGEYNSTVSHEVSNSL